MNHHSVEQHIGVSEQKKKKTFETIKYIKNNKIIVAPEMFEVLNEANKGSDIW